MRYARFKTSILGPEPKKQSSATSNKNRVTKSKKDTKVKKPQDTDSVKEEPDSQVSSNTQETVKEESPRVKHEMSQSSPDMPMLNMNMKSMFSQTSAPMPTANMGGQFHSRLLTPCSDSDAMAASSSYGASPSSDMIHADSPFDFTGSSPCAHTHDPQHMGWPHGHAYPTYGVNFDMNGYSAGPCDHQNSQIGGDQLGLHQHTQHTQHTQISGHDFGIHQHPELAGDELCASDSPMRVNDHSAMVKHEHWDDGGL
jgi:hypothetical protein